MLGYLEGTVIAHTNNGILLQVGSVGFDVLGVKLQRHPLGSSLALYTHLAVGNNNQPSLIGFASLEKRELFRQLLKVPGIGPKTALAVIEADSLAAVKNAILEGDINFFTRVKGLGKKAAQKILLELKNQLIEDPSENEAYANLYEALRSLRFSSQEIRAAIGQHDLSGLSESEALKIILQSLGK